MSTDKPDEGTAKFEPDNKAAREMALLAGYLVEHGREYSLTLDYSEGSIGDADALAVRLFEAIPHDSSAGLSEQERALILELGAYVGETFIRNHGGMWGWAETLDAGRNVGLRTNDGLIVFPVSTASNRLEGADVDSMVIFYRILTVWPQALGKAEGLRN